MYKAITEEYIKSLNYNLKNTLSNTEEYLDIYTLVIKDVQIVLFPRKVDNLTFYRMEVSKDRILKYTIPVYNNQDLLFYTKNIYKFIV